jgi:hypothetical protein
MTVVLFGWRRTLDVIELGQSSFNFTSATPACLVIMNRDTLGIRRIL